MKLVDIVYAMAPGGQQGGANPMGTFLMLGMIFAIFYFLLIRPQQRRQKQHREMLANLRKGDTVVTAGGLIGKIANITDSIVTLEVADKVRLKVVRSQISSVSTQPILEEISGGGSRKRS